MVSAAPAADLTLLGGQTRASQPTDISYAWQLEYRQDLFKHLAASVSYLNEGHIKEHHRDGYTAQLLARMGLLDERLTLAAAVGPYFFLDTRNESSRDGFSNVHSWKPMCSLSAVWRMKNDVLLELRSNFVNSPRGFDSTTILAGVGYHFNPLPETGPASATPADRETNHEVSVLLGQTIVNSFDSPRSIAASLEYRLHVSRHFQWTVAGLYEADNRLIRRDGIITQLWAVQPLTRKFAVGVGAGAYFDISHYDNPFQDTDTKRFVSGIVTLTSSYHFSRHWGVRASWNRVVTRYQRDADVILGGIGYYF
jgi:hypothetical protein